MVVRIEHHSKRTHLPSMVISSIRSALSDLRDPQLRAIVWKSVGLTVLGLIGVWFTLRALLEAMAIPYLEAFVAGFGVASLVDLSGMVGLFAFIAASIGLAIALAFLVGPVSALVAGIFLDDVAEHVERTRYPDAPPGAALAFARSLIMAIKFFGVVLLANAIALILLLVPVVNLIAFLSVNAYLLGREYFTFAALRLNPDEAAARDLRRRHRLPIFLAGLSIAGMLAVPILNLLTPIYGASLMIHLHRSILRRTPSQPIS